MAVYDSFLVVGGVAHNGLAILSLTNACGDKVAYGHTIETTTYTTGGPTPITVENVVESMVGAIGRMRIFLNLNSYCDLSMSIVGPVGSGKRSLAKAIATYYGKCWKIVDATEFGSKWMFETETKLLDKIKGNSRADIVSILVGVGNDRENEMNRNQVWKSITLGVANISRVLICSEKPYAQLSGLTTIRLCPGDYSAVREWLQYYHDGRTAADLNFIATELASQTIYPAHIASATGSTAADLLDSIRAAIIGDISLIVQPGELTIADFAAHVLYHTGSLRLSVQECIALAIPPARAGLLLYGPPGTGKSHTAHTLARASPLGTPRFIEGLAGISEAIRVWKTYGDAAAFYIILLDECESLFANQMAREAILRSCGNENSANNFFIIGTTNSPPGCFHQALLRGGRLKAQKVDWVTEEEYEEKLPGFPYIPGLSYMVLISLSEFYALHGTTDIELFHAEYFNLLTLDYEPPHMNDTERDAALAAVVNVCLHAKLTEVLALAQSVIGGAECNGFYCVGPDIIQVLPLLYDYVYWGPGQLSSMVAYDILSPPPRVAVILTKKDLEDRSCIKNIRPYISIFVCELPGHIDCVANGTTVLVNCDDPPVGPAGADGNGITNVVNNGDGTFTFHFTNGTTFTTINLTGPQGLQGLQGTPGVDGTGIASINDNGDGTLTITYTNGTVYVTPDFDGDAGEDGNGIVGITNNGDGTFTINLSDGSSHTTDNFTGPPGPPGEGIDFIDDNGDGTLTITITDGTSVLIVLPPGPAGMAGVAGIGIVDVQVFSNIPGSLYQLRFVFSDGTDYITANLLGPEGPAGTNGTSITNIVNHGDGTFTIVLSDGSSYLTDDFTGATGATGPAGTDGTNGGTGADGNGIAGVVNNGNGTFTITFTNGTTHITDNFTGPAGQDGVGIFSIVDHGDGTMTITLTNGVAILINLPVGAEGPMGADGNGISSVVNNGDGTFTFHFTSGPDFTTSDLTGPPGADGVDGVGIVSIIENPNTSITITLTSGAVYTSGPLVGDPGVGITNTIDNGDGTYTFVYSNGTTFTTSILTGEQGPIGPAGPAGVDGNDIIICSAYVHDEPTPISASSVLNDCSMSYNATLCEYTLVFDTPRAEVDYAVLGQSLEWDFSDYTAYEQQEAAVLAVVEDSRTVNGFRFVTAHPISHHQYGDEDDEARNTEFNIVVFDMGTAMA